MELNDYDKEFLVAHCKPVKELRLILSNIKPWEEYQELKDCKDFKYQDKQAYHYKGKYYYN